MMMGGLHRRSMEKGCAIRNPEYRWGREMEVACMVIMQGTTAMRA